MDNVIFYLPSPASQSQPPRVPGALAAATRSDQSIASKAIDQIASQIDPHDEKWTISVSQHRDETDFSPKRCSSVPHRRILGVDKQENLTDASLSGMQQTNSSASANPICDSDDGFADIDEILSSIQSKRTSARAKPVTASKDNEVDYSSQSTTSVDSRRSALGSTQNSIILSEDESICIDSETDYSISDTDPTLEGEAAFQPVADSELGVGRGLGSATTRLSRRRLVNDQGDNKLDRYGPDSIRLASQKPSA